MRIVVFASGSRGDVQPAIALAAALAARGHAARLVAPKNYAALAAGRGVDFHPLPIDVIAELETPEAEALFSGGGPIALMRWMAQAGRKAIAVVAPAALDGGAGADLIVATGLMDAVGATVAERLKVPCAHAWWTPMLAARDFLFAAGERAPPRLPGFANRAVFQAFEQALWLATRHVLRHARELYGLPPPPFLSPFSRAVKRGETLLLGYSEALLPRSREWPANVEVTGYWFLNDGLAFTPPPGLARFLAEDPTPIYVGFGSMRFRDRDASLDTVLKALARTGARAVVGAGWGGLARPDPPPNVFALDEAPHDWLFPSVAAVVHHGGAATTGAVLRAGRPSVVTPFIADQFAWGRLLAARGLAPPPLPHRSLNPDALAAAIETALSDESMRERAAAIGAAVRAEDGLKRAVAAIERIRA